MEKVYGWLLAVLMIFTLCVGATACGSKTDSEEAVNSGSSTESESEDSEEATTPVAGTWEAKLDMSDIVAPMIEESIAERNIVYDYETLWTQEVSYKALYMYGGRFSLRRRVAGYYRA